MIVAYHNKYRYHHQIVTRIIIGHEGNRKIYRLWSENVLKPTPLSHLQEMKRLGCLWEKLLLENRWISFNMTPWTEAYLCLSIFFAVQQTLSNVKIWFAKPISILQTPFYIKIHRNINLAKYKIELRHVGQLSKKDRFNKGYETESILKSVC